MSRYDSSNEINYDFFDENFLKNLLSFMHDSDDSSSSSGYDSDIFLTNDVVTSGHFNSFSSGRFKDDLIYRTCNLSDRIYVSWTTASTGLIPSSVSELKLSPTATPLKEELPIPKYLPLGIEPDPFSGASVEDKASFFRKSLKTLLLPEIENHPERLRYTKCVDYKPKAKSSVGTKENAFCPLKPNIKEKNTVSSEKQIQTSCRFCMKNGEPAVVYTGHVLKAPDGSVTCPILRRYVCDICGATGANSHTRKYCPVYVTKQKTS